MAAGQLFQVGAGQVADTSDDWYTPPWVFRAAGILFDIDVAAPADPARRTCPARCYYSPVEDGLAQPWLGEVWMNPPYSGAAPWVHRWAAHHRGLALLPARKECRWLGELLRAADALAIVNVEFGRPSGGTARLPFAMLLCGAGPTAAAAVARVAAADPYTGGAFHVRGMIGP